MAFDIDVRDQRFLLFEFLGIDKLLEFEKYKDFDKSTFEMVLEEAAKLAKNSMAPLNDTGDEEGAHFENGKVRTPKGFKEAFQTYAEAGWIGTASSPEWGGQGFPATLGIATAESFVSANCSLTMAPGLTRGAADMIETFASDELKNIYLEKLYSGKWAGTMCLTEPQAGSAVGDVKTMATPLPDGTYSIVGTKSFITFGEHDLTENIIHPVLARTPDAPPGIKGISLFLAPKYLVKPDGSLGEFNDITCTNIEHKMGIHASPTCTLNFGDNGKCKGWLIGKLNEGIKYMFLMMNEARIGVGVQGLALAAAAYLAALQYSNERIQGVDIRAMKDPYAPRVLIVKHPDVRRMLLTMKSYVEGCRALLYQTAYYGDLALSHPDEAERAKYHGFIELLTPICKAYVTDQAFRVTELAVQVHGGFGYCKEYKVEQYLRDCKITSIYEGTNGIQALDLLGRKVGMKGGMVFMQFMMEINSFADAYSQHPLFGELIKSFAEAKDKLAEVTMTFGMMGASDPLYPVLNATVYLDMFGEVVLSWLLLREAILANDKLDEIYKSKGISDDEGKKALLTSHADARFYWNKIQGANFFVNRVLPGVISKAKAVNSQDRSSLEAVFEL